MERRKLQQEKDELQVEFDKLKLEKADELGQREKFYEGASWLCKQSLTVADDAVSKSETLKTEYLKKIAESQGDEFLRGRAAEWLLDSALRIAQ